MFATHNLVCAAVAVEGSQLQLVQLCLSYRSQRCTAVDGYVHALSILSQQGPTDCFSKPFVPLVAFSVDFLDTGGFTALAGTGRGDHGQAAFGDVLFLFLTYWLCTFGFHVVFFFEYIFFCASLLFFDSAGQLTLSGKRGSSCIVAILFGCAQALPQVHFAVLTFECVTFMFAICACQAFSSEYR